MAKVVSFQNIRTCPAHTRTHTRAHTHPAVRKATLKASATSASSHERLRAGRLMGKGPQWKESLQQARLRYVKRYLDYLRRARHTKKSCLLVTHGHMVQVCASVLPVNQHRKIVSVDYCGAAVAECHRLVKDRNRLTRFFLRGLFHLILESIKLKKKSMSKINSTRRTNSSKMPR